MITSDMSKMLWQPSDEHKARTNLTHFMRFLEKQTGTSFQSYDELYQWSVSEKEFFWSYLWDFADVIGDKGERALVNGQDIEQALWFPDAKLNFAENLLCRRDDETAIVFRAENQVKTSLSWSQLYQQVASLAAWFEQQGLKPGDRVAGYLPNMPEAVVAMLATTSLGAVWTSTSPDFGEESVIDRFGQTQPRFLFTVDGYFYNGKQIDIREKVRTICSQLPSVEKTVQVNLLGLSKYEENLAWEDLLSTPADNINFVRTGFNDPLYILYSSGTTGQPKCITHKVGGVLLQHLKELLLHSDVRANDRVFFFTTCGWMMWNWLVSALACKASLMLYDGSPFYLDGNVLWDYADQENFTLFGTSAKYIEAMNKGGLSPKNTHNLESLRTICSTGSVLSPESFDYVYEQIKTDVCLSSISGGTDIVSCFALGCPILPVYRGESQCRGLGLAVQVFDDEGHSVVEEKGELVCTETFPCQPAFFWGDENGEKYHNAYFARYKNIWHHGDYVLLSERGGVTFFGRSDAVLNPGGVRIGTAEIYRHVEQLDEVLESIAIGQDWDNDVRVILFVVLANNAQLDEELIKKIKLCIRNNCTPRHVPAKVLQVTEIPRTKSGKIVELAVRDTIHGKAINNTGALANPGALEQYRNRKELNN